MSSNTNMHPECIDNARKSLCNDLTYSAPRDKLDSERVNRMSKTVNLSIRIDQDLKKEADQIFNEMGMNLTTAITIFLQQAVREKRIPFQISLLK